MSRDHSFQRLHNATFSRRLVFLGIGLTLLFTAISPESTRSLSVLSRALFWGLHIGIGLVMAVGVARVLIRYTGIVQDWRLVLYSGIGGVLFFAPIALGLESLFPVADGGADSDWADRFARTSLLAGIAVEAWELSPSYLASWALINFIPSAVTTTAAPAPSARTTSDATAPSTTAVDTTPPGEPKERHATSATSAIETEPAGADRSSLLCERLPPAIGKTLIAVSSDLNYLHVYTREGKAMVLGALQDVEKEFGDAGLRVHRSHWVSLDAVVSLHKVSSGWQLEMSNGYRVPVSRRKKALVQKCLGGDFVRMTRSA